MVQYLFVFILELLVFVCCSIFQKQMTEMNIKYIFTCFEVVFISLDKNKCTAEFELKTQAFVSLVLIMRAKIVEMGLQRAQKKWKG